jgi:hypothetical protein
MTLNDRLDGWKVIADFLHESIRNAQRQRRDKGLPVHGEPGEIVWASKKEIDEWRVRPIRSAILSGDQLTAVDALGKTVWIRPLPGALEYRDEELNWRVQVIRLLGQTKPSVLVACRFQNPAIPNALICFSPDGSERWAVPANPDLRHRTGKEFEKAWRYSHVVVSPSGAIFASFTNSAGWAGGILRIDAEGKSSVHFANAGYVERICVVVSEGREYIIAAGENNDYDQAFTALIGVEDQPCVSVPGDRSVYRYSTMITAYPRKYILFPRTELIEARGRPYGHVRGIQQFPGRIIIHIETGDVGQFLYHFSEALEPVYAFPSGTHEGEHRQMEASGLMNHVWPNCPELAESLRIRIWEPGAGWRDETIPWRDNPWQER